MMIAPACVAIQIIGAPAATPGDVASLQERCSEILGGQRCHVVLATGGEAGATPNGGQDPCWRATVTMAGSGVAAQVALRVGTDPGAPRTYRDLTFQERDAVGERWAALGLMIAALVTLEERTAKTAEKTAERTAAAPPPPAAAARPPPIAAPTIAVPGERMPARWRRPPMHAALVGVVAGGQLPGTALGARVEAGVEASHAGAVVRFAYFPERRGTIPVAAGVGGGAFHLWSLGLGGCGHAALGHGLHLRGCAGGDLTSTSARGFGIAESTTAQTLTTTLWGGPGLRFELARWIALTIDPELLLALQRPTFVVRGAGTAFTPARVGGSVALGVAVRL